MSENRWNDPEWRREYGARKARERRARDPKVRAADAKHRKAGIDKRRAIIETAKDVPCADCGQRYPVYVMDFDHQGDKAFGIGRQSYSVSIDQLVAEIAKCDVVCANCHRERTWGGVYAARTLRQG